MSSLLLGASVGCGSSDTEADRWGVAAICESDDDCAVVVVDGEETRLTCLTQFEAGYCAIEDCQSSDDCPEGSSCVAHTDGNNYCFRQCKEKAECNANRPAESQANCSANFDWAVPGESVSGLKACIPPSSGS